MPRTSLLPSPTFSSYSKLQKSNSSLSSSATSSRFPPLHLFIFSLFSLSVGIGGTFYSLTAYRRSHSLPVIFRCGHSHDTFRALYSSSSISRPVGEHRPKLLGLVGVQTRFGSEDRRAALRNTWFPSDADQLLRLEQATGLAFRFVIGRSKDAKKMKELEKEVDNYKDFMLIDVEEENLKLPYKTLAFLRAAFELFDADYYVKADDVIYLRPDRLATLLAKERTHPLTYTGCMKKGPVITDPKLKWYEKSRNLLGSEYFMHASGPIYVLSAQVVASLATAKNDSLRMFNNEDVTIGSWMLSMNVHHEDNRAMCDPQCTPTSIAVWDFPKCSGLCNPVSQMRQLHKTSMCSKSPTLPPEEEEER